MQTKGLTGKPIFKKKKYRLFLESVGYSAFGLANGLLLSVFFKQKVRVIGFTTGFGFGLAVHKNANGLIQHILRKQ